MENNFATNLKFLRIQKGLTQEDLAKKLDKDYSTIGKWESGQRSPIMLDAIRVAELFDISLENLISKDLRLKSTPEKQKLTEEEKQEALRQVLKEKGILDENDEMSEEDFDRLLDFAKANKDFILKDK